VERQALVPLSVEAPQFKALLARQPYALVHAAGSASVADSVREPHEDFRSSVALFEEVIDAVRRLSPGTRVLLLSSAAVYGNPTHLPIDESAPTAPVSPYGHHKLLSEQLGRMYQTFYDVPFCSIRIFSAYGKELRRQVVFDVAQKLRSARAGETVVLRGTGRESRDFIHGEDVARAVLCVLDGAAFAGESYNVASGQATRIEELASSIRDQLRSDATVEFDGIVRSGDVLYWQANVSKLRGLGFRPQWTLQAGIRDMLTSEHGDVDSKIGDHVKLPTMPGQRA